MPIRALKLAVSALVGVAWVVPGVAEAQYYAPPPPPPGYYDDGRATEPGWRGERHAARRGYYERRGYYGRRPDRRCDRGAGGTILGAIAGGLLGNAVAGRGDRGVGTIVGAGAGALTGRAIDRRC